LNLIHSWICNSDDWRRKVEEHVVPWTLEGLEFHGKVLEIGPGYGATTDVVRTRVEQLVCVEINPRLAEKLRRRMVDHNVIVLCQDATCMPLPDAMFDGAVCFTMLHHVPSPALQDRLLAEVARLLRPGAIFAGRDSLSNLRFRLLHLFDTLTPVDPSGFAGRLKAAGFADPRVDVAEGAFRFRARKP
jgi:SAM-dependent methyltransferase